MPRLRTAVVPGREAQTALWGPDSGNFRPGIPTPRYETRPHASACPCPVRGVGGALSSFSLASGCSAKSAAVDVRVFAARAQWHSMFCPKACLFGSIRQLLARWAVLLAFACPFDFRFELDTSSPPSCLHLPCCRLCLRCSVHRSLGRVSQSSHSSQCLM